MNKSNRGDYGNPPNTQPKSVPKGPKQTQQKPKPVRIKGSNRGR